MSETETKRPSFEMSIDTRLIYERMKQAAVGEVISFRALSEVIGNKVEGDNPSIQSALRKLLGEEIVFENVRGVGYKRLNDVEIVQTYERDRVSIQRKARKAVKRLTCVQDFEALPNELKVRHNAAVSGFAAIANMLKTGSMKKLETAVEHAREQLPLAKTLEAFKG